MNSVDRHAACKAKVRKPGYWARDGVDLIDNAFGRAIGVIKMIWIDDTSSKQCRAAEDADKTGPCAGCEFPQDRGYLVRTGLAA